MKQTNMDRAMSKSKGGCITTMVILIIVVIGFVWLLSTGDEKTQREKDLARAHTEAVKEADAIISDEGSGSTDVKAALYGSLLREIRKDLDSYYVEYLNVEVSESGCLWVYVVDNGKDRDGIATTLCSTAKKHYVRCVTIVDRSGNTLGRAMCD